MLGSKIRAGVLGLMVMLLLGSYAATSAYAEAGPFCHKRSIGSEGAGTKITSAAPEFVQGEGGEQRLTGASVTVVASSVQVKGILYNNEDQCQTKLELKYHEPHLVNHPLCTATVGGPANAVKVVGHLAWKWNGTLAQLEEQPQKEQVQDWIFLPSKSELNTQGGFPGELPKEELTILTFAKNTECGILSGTASKVIGSLGGVILAPNHGALETWTSPKEPEVFYNSGTQLKQHIWWGSLNRFVGVDVSFELAGGPASLTGAFTVFPDYQEIAHFEK